MLTILSTAGLSFQEPSRANQDSISYTSYLPPPSTISLNMFLMISSSSWESFFLLETEVVISFNLVMTSFVSGMIQIQFLSYIRKFQIYTHLNYNTFELQNIKEIFNKGITLRKTGNPRESILYFNKILERNPDHLDALLNKGHALGRLGRYHDAIFCYEHVLKIEKKNVLGLINTGLCYHYLRDYDKAIAYYDMILKTYPKHSNTLYHKACSKALQDKQDESIGLLEQAISLDISFRVKARGDTDFDKIRNNERFASLVGKWNN